MAVNRLAHEKSPYLLQHAENPVDWYPWGEEAFARARSEDRPVFLSIGYSTCHWCHVMERESFEDPDVAALMNEAFVSIKVDREERPDIDSIYMKVCQLMTGSGGWPLTIVMTPEKEPFFAATYIPKTSRHGRVGMLDLVPRLRDVWASRREDVGRSATGIRSALERASALPRGADPGLDDIEAAARLLRASFDPLQGGFGRAPKFPTPHTLGFLLRYGNRTGDPDALRMVETTLRAMRRGGIWDHVGFGFHRYSTDARWLVPHFEKMLYDQALLTLVYLEAAQVTGRPEYLRTAREILAYVLRDMVDESGGFHAAEDADSEGEEGKYYVWSDADLRRVLDDETFLLVKEVYNVEQAGNFADEATGGRTGRNILHLRQDADELSERLAMSEADLAERLDSARRTLFAERSRRVRPHRDDKILTDWNGLIIAALARGSWVLGAPQYASAAARAAQFLLRELRGDRGRLLHRYRGGDAGIPAMADDYAFLVWGLLELYTASFEANWLAEARRLNAEFIARFYDEDAGGFFQTAVDAERLLVRGKDSYDGAIPSANSVALANLLRLARLTGEPSLEDLAAETAHALGGRVASSPTGHTHFLAAIDFALGPTREVVIVGDRTTPATQALLAPLRERFLPRTVILLKEPGAAGAATPLEELAPFTRPLSEVNGAPAAYVCRDFSCDRPVTDVEALENLLG